jgi:hypothetical protein
MCFACGWGGTLLGFAGGYLVGRETPPRTEHTQTHKYCQNCGANIDVISRFCPYCGKEQLSQGPTQGGSTAIEILKERYAKGEISTEEFQRMRRGISE